MIRNATTNDLSRLAEILIFAKRVAYRKIFHDDIISFNKMQVVPLALDLQKKGVLDSIIVYDDGIVKGMMNRKIAQYDSYENSLQLCEFYIDPFFQHNGIGQSMMKAFLNEAVFLHVECVFLWVLEKNYSARKFYEKSGFVYDGNRKPENGTDEYILRYSKTAK